MVGSIFFALQCCLVVLIATTSDVTIATSPRDSKSKHLEHEGGDAADDMVCPDGLTPRNFFYDLAIHLEVAGNNPECTATELNQIAQDLSEQFDAVHDLDPRLSQVTDIKNQICNLTPTQGETTGGGSGDGEGTARQRRATVWYSITHDYDTWSRTYEFNWAGTGACRWCTDYRRRTSSSLLRGTLDTVSSISFSDDSRTIHQEEEQEEQIHEDSRKMQSFSVARRNSVTGLTYPTAEETSSWTSNADPRCGLSELDARGHCKPKCTTLFDCEDGERCLSTHWNYCDYYHDAEHTDTCTDADASSSREKRCGQTEASAREFCGTPCTSSADCTDPLEYCVAVFENFCDCAAENAAADTSLKTATTTSASFATTTTNTALSTLRASTTTTTTTDLSTRQVSGLALYQANVSPPKRLDTLEEFDIVDLNKYKGMDLTIVAEEPKDTSSTPYYVSFDADEVIDIQKSYVAPFSISGRADSYTGALPAYVGMSRIGTHTITAHLTSRDKVEVSGIPYTVSFLVIDSAMMDPSPDSDQELVNILEEDVSFGLSFAVNSKYFKQKSHCLENHLAYVRIDISNLQYEGLECPEL